MDIVQNIASTQLAGNANGNKTGKTALDDHQFALMDLIPVPAVYIGRQGHVEYVNTAFPEWSGFASENIIGKNAFDLFGPASNKIIERQIKKALQGEKVGFESEISFPDRRFYVEASWKPEFDDKGGVIGVLGILIDITQKKKSLVELQKSQAELKDYVENAAIGMHWVNENGIIIWANQAELNMLGYANEEYIGHHISEFHLDKKMLDDILERLRKNENIDQCIARLQCKDGSVRMGMISSSVLWEDGKFVHTRCFTTDVTDYLEVQKRIEESERRHRHLLNVLPVAVYTCDKEGRITFYNETAVKLWGYAPDINSNSLRFCACYKVWTKEGIYVPPEKTFMAVALKTGQSFRNLEAVVERPSGERFQAIVNIDPLFDANGEVSGAINIFQDTSERESMESALREGEFRYRSLIHGLPAAVYTTDSNGYITMYNEAAAKLWERQPEVGRDQWCGSWKIYELDGTTEVPLDQCPMAVALKEKRKVISEHPYIVETPSGKRKYFIPYPEPIFDEKGAMTGAFNMLMDVTDSKLAEEEKAKLAAIVESSDDAIIGKTLQGIITSWNGAAEKLFGYTGEEIIGQPVTRLIPPDRMDEEPRILEHLRNGDKVDHFETKRLTKAGKLIDISLTISPIKDRAGHIIGASKIVRDITEKSKVEEINARLAAIVQFSDVAIVGKTLQGVVTSWNNAAEKLFGYTAEEMIGESITKIIPPDRLEEEPQILARLARGERIEHFETRRMKKDGTIRDISLTISPIKNSNGEIIGASKIASDVTAQNEAERLIHESEERLRMAVETTNLGTWEYSPRESKLLCSGESQKICGLPADTYTDFRSIVYHIHEEDRAYFLETVKRAVNGTAKDRFDMELRIHRYDDSEVRWINAKGKIFFNSNLYPERIIGTLLDITERKIKEQELRDSMGLFQTMADNVPAMIWMSGVDKFEDYFNKTWLEFTGRTLEQERDEKWLEGVHPDDVQRCIDTYNASFKQQSGFYTEYRLRRYDGEYRWISDNSVPRFSPNGEFLGFISACMDFDDQKRFREKIQESELLFKTISNASPAALWMTNENEENVFISDTWLKWTGKSFDDVIGQGWVQSLVPEDRERIVNEFRESFKQRKHFRAEFRFLKGDGELCWGLTEGYPFYDFNSLFSGFAGSVTDITDIKKLEQRKDDFIKMASHELKTPITSINGYVQLLMNIYNEADEQRLRLSKSTVKSSLTTIAKQVVKLTRLISELLDLSKIESGKLELNKTAFNMADLVEETVQDVRQTTSKHAIIVHNDFEGKVLADKDRIGQVLLNLLTNAVKYSPDADNIEVYIQNTRDMAVIKVRDYGIGIDKKDHFKIFDRFYRVEGRSEQTFPGFGIGLFIANEIIQRHDGKITVESAKGKGSTFTVSLPLIGYASV